MTPEAIKFDSSKREVWELIQTLVAGQVPADRILELYYWSQEPGALEMVRTFLSLSKRNRAMLNAYFGSVDCRSISIEADGAGKITLSSSNVRGSSRIPSRQLA